MGKIAIYTRVSSVKQLDKDGDSLGVQKYKCESLLKSQGYSEDKFVYYCDEGLSGSSIIKRDDLSALLKKISEQDPKNKENDEDYIEGLCCMNLSRLSRSLKHSVEIFNILKENEIKFYTVDGAFFGDTDTATSKIMVAIFGMLNELYIDHLKSVVYPGMEESARNGNYQGGNPPLGYTFKAFVDETVKGANNDKAKRKSKQMLIPDPKEQLLIELIFDLFTVKKNSLHEVAKQLNLSGKKTKTGKQFSTNTVSKILENPIYAGRCFWGKKKLVKYNSDTGKRDYQKTSIYDVNILELPKGKHEAIISEDLFLSTIDRLRERKQADNRENKSMTEARTGVSQQVYYDNHKRMFSNILICPNCAGKMTSSLQPGHKRKDGTISEPKVYYKCNSFNAGKNSCDGYYSVQEDKVFSIIKEDFFKALGEGFELIREYTKYLAELRGENYYTFFDSEIQKLKEELAEIEKTRRSSEKTISKLITKQLSLEETSPEYNIANKLIEEASLTIKQAEKRIITLEEEIRNMKERNEALINDIKEQENYKNFEEYFSRLPLIKKRELLEMVYDKIIIYTSAKSSKGPKDITDKEIILNPFFTPTSLYGIIDVKDRGEFEIFAAKRGIRFTSLDKHFPNKYSYFKELASGGKGFSQNMREYIDEVTLDIRLSDNEEIEQDNHIDKLIMEKYINKDIEDPEVEKEFVKEIDNKS